MEEMESAILAATTPTVQIWMNWMLIIFIASILFVWKYKSARIVLAALVLTLPTALLIFNITNSVHLIGIAHILIWGPLAFYLVKVEVMRPGFKSKTPYGIWIILLLGTIFISLLFDVRDVFLVMFGMK